MYQLCINDSYVMYQLYMIKYMNDQLCYMIVVMYMIVRCINDVMYMYQYLYRTLIPNTYYHIPIRLQYALGYMRACVVDCVSWERVGWIGYV